MDGTPLLMLVKATIIMMRLEEKDRIKHSRGRGILTIGKKKVTYKFKDGKDDKHAEGIFAHPFFHRMYKNKSEFAHP
eukprot:15356804-Ditylum_brightwellii.AAC.1